MKNYISGFIGIIALTFVVPPVFAEQSRPSCPGQVHHVLVELGHYKPWFLVPPDVGDNEGSNAQEWIDLNEKPDQFPVTVHCYYNKAASRVTDIAIPSKFKKCSLREGLFYCS